MDYKKLAETILKNVGGEKNVTGLVHCATRLRFNLKDENKANTDILKDTRGVMGVVKSGGQYQVIIGSDVANVYKPLIEMCNISENNGNEEKKKQSILSKFVDTLTGIFTPILPAVTAAGMVKVVITLLVTFKLLDNTSETYKILEFISDAGFYFLPIFLANSAAKKFKCNPYLAMFLGGVLLHPTFVNMVNTVKETGEGIALFGIPVYAAGYASSVIPIILTVWVMSYIEPFADKISHHTVKFFTKPLITILVTSILSLTVLAPIGYIISEIIAKSILTLEQYCSWLVPTILGGIFPLLVMTGTHYAIIPMAINNRVTLGYDTILNPSNNPSNIGQGAASLAVALKTKNSEIKQIALSSGITGVCGITEPALYGVNLRFKTPLYAAMIGGACGGFFNGINGVKNYVGGSPGLLTLPGYIGGDSLRDFYLACIGATIGFVVSFIISYILYKDPIEETEKIKEENIKEQSNITIKTDNIVNNSNLILSPAKGKAVPLSQVNDEAFSQEIMGKGGAIILEDGKIYSPVDATVEAIFDTLHAIGIKTDDGVEILIHIGLDTVKLGGKHFKAYAKVGDKVKAGTLLVEADIEKIKSEGYDIITPVIINNSYDFGDVIVTTNDNINVGDSFIKVIK
ncbi:beta-glucoside-specific PTS transporter subunit IIABC [[Clostridium] colinum]|uniref:beta-glucoside-specific PTS transporter subunit IIABC n=1 Tax=[Clostridium] colinum TaxID=36835 RepID=UPI002025139B|nr:beta-glucoside-specific PTS transporter subunit IIABC [[Clostridium] colinum]